MVLLTNVLQHNQSPLPKAFISFSQQQPLNPPRPPEKLSFDGVVYTRFYSPQSPRVERETISNYSDPDQGRAISSTLSLPSKDLNAHSFFRVNFHKVIRSMLKGTKTWFVMIIAPWMTCSF
ncbi:uncharacterized protein LOC132300704 isoform X2 [Cornus florida]|uniref:uncharacterized protein LOC132300704 isoform X2 n=1 Tax=Cornus florida TaxID=4283 RepID=UPI002896A49C|nr:uncharacterized protein LOC132300704 isoform X2 [Cornus florida]